MSLKEVFGSIIEQLNGGASVRAVYGEPVEAQGKTIIPVAKVMYGFGGGFGETGKEKKNGADKEGGGAGGGVRAKPVGVIEITEEDTRFVPCCEGKKYAMLLALGFVVGFLIGRR
ncbi:MAG TPA: spore germination protein GerW family protein [Thermodesulfobacteriota bacterium]|nr:spore germination protein GerW family protein [Thermodesulfobacteriota bacterium]